MARGRGNGRDDRDELDPDRAVLTRRLVADARARLEHSAGLLSVRRALLYDPTAGVSDRDVGRWLGRGTELQASGDPPATEHDELCLELVRLDAARGGPDLLRAGQAMRRILESRDPRAYSAQSRLIVHMQGLFAEAEPQGAPARPGVSQEDMDALDAAELARVEELLAERARISAELERVVAGARRRRAAAASGELH